MIDWREIGDVSGKIWADTLLDERSPLFEEFDEAYDAAQPHTALCLAMLHRESSYATAFNRNKPENRNPLNLRPPDGIGYMAYSSWPEGVRSWKERITDPTYKNGIYANTTSLDELIGVYAPAHDSNDEGGYVRSIESDLARWSVKVSNSIPLESGGSMPTPTTFDLSVDFARFGLTQSEAGRILDNRFENRQGQKPSFIVLHIQAGTTRSSLDWWANGPGVEASSTVMIQHDGSVLKIIPEQHGPWTNGDDNQPTPTGQRLVNLPGNSNLHTLSIEAEGMSGADTTAAQLDSIVWQVEQWMAKYGIPKANVIRHGDVNSVDRPNCPGAYYPLVMARIGSTPTPATLAKKKPIPKPVKTKQYGGKVFARHHGSLTLTRSLAPLQYASPTATPVGKPYDATRKVTIQYSTIGDDGLMWFVDSTGGRWPADAFADVA